MILFPLLLSPNLSDPTILFASSLMINARMSEMWVEGEFTFVPASSGCSFCSKVGVVGLHRQDVTDFLR